MSPQVGDSAETSGTAQAEALRRHTGLNHGPSVKDNADLGLSCYTSEVTELTGLPEPPPL